MLRLLALLSLVLGACDETDDGPNGPHCVEVRMRWLEIDYLRRQANMTGDSTVAMQRALLQDSIVNADLPCFPGFMLR